MNVMTSSRSHLRRALLCAALPASVVQWPAGTAAQTITVDSIDPIQSDLGVLVSAASGDTVFQISPADGLVTKQSGQGSRQGSGMARALVTLRCTDSPDCETAEATVTIAAGGSAGRAGPLTAFAVAAGPNPPTMSMADGSDVVTFTVTGIPEGQSRNFYLGADFTLLAAGDTGVGATDFTVSVPGSIRSGGFIATTWRPITVSNITDLSFGRIVLPTSGNATVELDVVSGEINVTGSGAFALPTPPPSLAQFQVSGEGSQSFTVDVPPSFTLNGPGEDFTVTTNNDADAGAILSGSSGSEGSYSFRVGGSFSISESTTPGFYSGGFQMTVLYN